MKSRMFVAFAFATITLTLADSNKNEIIAFTPYKCDGSLRRTTPTAASERSCSGTQVRTVYGSIVSRCPPANVSSRIRIRSTNWSPSLRELGIWARERNSTPQI